MVTVLTHDGAAWYRRTVSISQLLEANEPSFPSDVAARLSGIGNLVDALPLEGTTAEIAEFAGIIWLSRACADAIWTDAQGPTTPDTINVARAANQLGTLLYDRFRDRYADRFDEVFSDVTPIWRDFDSACSFVDDEPDDSAFIPNHPVLRILDALKLRQIQIRFIEGMYPPAVRPLLARKTESVGAAIERLEASIATAGADDPAIAAAATTADEATKTIVPRLLDGYLRAAAAWFMENRRRILTAPDDEDGPPMEAAAAAS
jgi:hypothetical protein